MVTDATRGVRDLREWPADVRGWYYRVACSHCGLLSRLFRVSLAWQFSAFVESWSGREKGEEIMHSAKFRSARICVGTEAEQVQVACHFGYLIGST